MLRIGLMGAPTNSGNLGCVALTYSLISVLENIRKTLNAEFTYVLFEWKYNQESFNALIKNINISADTLEYSPYTLISNPIKNIYHFTVLNKMKKKIKSCDLIIDITEGDSFSDIYGDEWFDGRTNIKLFVEKMGIPLILAPQTYGPYLKKQNELKAIKAIKGAYGIMTRDEQSYEVLNNKLHTDPVYTTDLAFWLPYKKDFQRKNNKKRIGLNVSRLLSQEGNEVGEKRFSLTVNYQRYIEEIILSLSASEKNELYLIPHVKGDHQQHIKLKEKYPSLNLIDPFSDPVEAKSFISTMDVFIGARMHGTIAAFTSGTPCIPTAYSPKFSGLFKGFGYDPIIDLTTMDTETAVKHTLSYIDDLGNLKRKTEECRLYADKYVLLIQNVLENWINEIVGRKENEV